MDRKQTVAGQLFSITRLRHLLHKQTWRRRPGRLKQQRAIVLVSKKKPIISNRDTSSNSTSSDSISTSSSSEDEKEQKNGEGTTRIRNQRTRRRQRA